MLLILFCILHCLYVGRLVEVKARYDNATGCVLGGMCKL